MINQSGAGLLRVLRIIGESKDADEAESREWASRDEEDATEAPNDPSLWDGAGINFELDDEDWASVETLIEEGSDSSLSEPERQFLSEIGFIEDGKPTQFASDWHQKLSKPRESEIPLDEREPEPES